MTDLLHYQSLVEVASRVHARDLSPVTLAEALLRRITAVDPTLHSYTCNRGARASKQTHAAPKPTSPPGAIVGRFTACDRDQGYLLHQRCSDDLWLQIAKRRDLLGEREERPLNPVYR